MLKLGKVPQGEVTDIGTIELGRQLFQDKRVLAYVLLSDGMQNSVQPEYDLQQVVRNIADSQTPFHSVAFGQATRLDQFADLSIENMPDQYSMFVKNELVISATLTARGFAGRTVPVQLFIKDAEGNEQKVETQRIAIQKNIEQIPIEMTYIPELPGNYRIRLEVPAQSTELATRNNELPAFLNVFDGGLRVLYLEGEYRAERKFLKRAIDASPDIDMDIIQLPERGRDRWPLELTRLFKDSKYDVFMIGDLDSRALHEPNRVETNLEELAQAVNQGKGLMMLGGYHSFGPGGYGNTPLADLLPVVMRQTETQNFDQPVRSELHHERPLRIRSASSHFLTRVGQTENGKDLWDKLPPLSGANRFRDLKPTAQILLESRSGEPLLVSANVGGRVLAFAGDSTWRWWMHGRQDVHKRFWRQVILWLAKRDGLNNDSVWINLPQRPFRSRIRD